MESSIRPFYLTKSMADVCLSGLDVYLILGCTLKVNFCTEKSSLSRNNWLPSDWMVGWFSFTALTWMSHFGMRLSAYPKVRHLTRSTLTTGVTEVTYFRRREMIMFVWLQLCECICVLVVHWQWSMLIDMDCLHTSATCIQSHVIYIRENSKTDSPI